ncbi:MAG: thioredoxin family protein [Planctomycetota bacterium]|jgi:thioredoxin 1
MRHRSWTLALFAISLVAATADAEPPPVFFRDGYDAARETAGREGKLLLVDSTAVWCMPCKMMDRQTWVAAEVVEWIEEHAIAVQVDVDQERKLASELRIQAMPTMIVFREGKELDRIVGFRNPAQLLQWLNGLLEGRRAIDDVRDAAEKETPDGGVDIGARYRMAKTLVQGGDLDKATAEYLWLWDNMLEHAPSYTGVRLSFMLIDMKQLAKQHMPARDAFTKLRDRYEPLIKGDRVRREDLIDWIRLNGMLGDTARTLRWYDAAVQANDAERIGPVADDLFGLLLAEGRWAEAGQLYEDPVATARRAGDLYVQIMKLDEAREGPEDQRQLLRQIQEDNFIEGQARLYAALLAADRNEEAANVAALLLRRHDDARSRLSMVEQALAAGAPRAIHEQWLAGAGEADQERVRSAQDRLRELADRP